MRAESKVTLNENKDNVQKKNYEQPRDIMWKYLTFILFCNKVVWFIMN